MGNHLLSPFKTITTTNTGCAENARVSLAPAPTFPIEELPGVLPTESQVTRNGTHQLNYVGQVILVTTVVFPRMRLKQVVPSC